MLHIEENSKDTWIQISHHYFSWLQSKWHARPVITGDIKLCKQNRKQMCEVNKPVASADGILSPLEPSVVIVSANISITVTSPIYTFRKWMLLPYNNITDAYHEIILI